jgi:hypothetical protein
MHESYITGKPSRNFLAAGIKGDNFYEQIKIRNVT